MIELPNVSSENPGSLVWSVFSDIQEVEIRIVTLLTKRKLYTETPMLMSRQTTKSEGIEAQEKGARRLECPRGPVYHESRELRASGGSGLRTCDGTTVIMDAFFDGECHVSHLRSTSWCSRGCPRWRRYWRDCHYPGS